MTHVVAARDGTEKINQARRIQGCTVVKASWLMECLWSLTKRDVAGHILGNGAAASTFPSTGSKTSAKDMSGEKSNSSDSTSSSDESDGFAADFEQSLMDDM